LGGPDFPGAGSAHYDSRTRFPTGFDPGAHGAVKE
jgi:hypothetical protein